MTIYIYAQGRPPGSTSRGRKSKATRGGRPRSKSTSTTGPNKENIQVRERVVFARLNSLFKLTIPLIMWMHKEGRIFIVARFGRKLGIICRQMSGLTF